MFGIGRTVKKRLKRIKNGLFPPVDLHELRRRFSFKYIRKGSGLEIGALHCPTPVRPGVGVRYVDKRTTGENRRHYSHYDVSKIVSTDIVDDGFRLSAVSPASQDFVIANHVLEHAPDLFGALRAWSKALKPKGLMLVSVPLAHRCFDAGRTPATVEHCMEDHRLALAADHEALYRRNREHYLEWVTISKPNQTLQKGLPYSMPPDDEARHLAEELTRAGADIHFHAFSLGSFKKLLKCFCTVLEPSMRIAGTGMSAEAVAVLYKKKAT